MATEPMKPTRLDAETQSIIRGALDRFVEDVGDLTARRARLAMPVVDERLHWDGLAQLGLFGLAFPESVGGMGGSAVDMADAVRSLARGLIIEPWVESAVIAACVVQATLPQRAQAQTDIDAIIGGESLVVLVGGRPGDAGAITCTPGTQGWLLNGQAQVVVGAACADQWLIASRDPQGQVCVFRLQRGEPLNLRQAHYRLMDGRSASDIFFENVQLPAEALLLQGAAAEAALERASTLAAVAYAADAVGVMEELVKSTGAYLRTRVQFGVPLSSFQALQHRLADMQIALLEARAITRLLADSADGGDLARQAWLRFAAALVIERTAPKVAHEAIQMHGGMGVTDELAVSHCNARLVVLVKLLQAGVPTVSPLSTAGRGE